MGHGTESGTDSLAAADNENMTRVEMHNSKAEVHAFPSEQKREEVRGGKAMTAPSSPVLGALS